MLSRYRFALRPGWWVLHVFTLAAVITMILLGRWQLMVSDRKHFAIQNFGYALQWWAFTLFALIMWVRIVRDNAGHTGTADATTDVAAETGTTATAPATSGGEPVTYRRYVMPASSAAPEDDVQAAYNDYLAALDRPYRAEESR